MSWNLSEQEFESLLSMSGAKRYSYFVKKVADWEEVWSLRSQDRWVLAADPAGTEIIPVWPHERFAKACADGEWQGCEPDVIHLRAWMERWLPCMAKDSRQVAVFPTPQDKGVVIRASQLNEDLSDKCEEYE